MQSQRSAAKRSILRLHNQTFLHAISCEEVIGKPQILSEKKFYGRNLHSLVVHAPIQHRIICSRSTNTEEQERHFNTFSSRRPGEILTPGILRIQAEVKAEENNQRDTLKEQQSRLAKLARCLPPAPNTIIPHRVILKYPRAYQAHLEKLQTSSSVVKAFGGGTSSVVLNSLTVLKKVTAVIMVHFSITSAHTHLKV